MIDSDKVAQPHRCLQLAATATMQNEMNGEFDLKKPSRITWLDFWIYLWLPAWGSLAVYSGLVSSSRPGISWQMLIGTIQTLLGLGVFALANGLRRRETWAWKTNLIIVFGQPLPYLGLPLLVVVTAPGTSSISARDCAAYIFLTAVVLGTWAAWSLPNYIYFKKRRILFH